MSDITSLVGRRFAPADPYSVGREHVRSFARAVFASNAIHFDVTAARAGGFADVVAPVTYPAVLQDVCLQLFLADPAVDFELKNVVHGDEAFRYTRPIVAGDELRSELEVASIKSLGANSMISADTTITDAAGEHVVTATATLVVRTEAAQ